MIKWLFKNAGTHSIKTLFDLLCFFIVNNENIARYLFLVVLFMQLQKYFSLHSEHTHIYLAKYNPEGLHLSKLFP